MQKYKSNITTTSGAAVRGVPVLVIDKDGNNAALFLDRAGTVPAPNPLTTGPDGVFYFYAVNGRYSLRTTVEGVTITDDDVVLMMDPEEITVAGPIAEAVAAAQAAAIAAEFSVEASGIPDLVAAAQNAVVDSNNAVTQATSAANNAALSKTGADSARDAAVIAKNAAETALDSFDDRYLGAKASAPATDNDGGALLTGALYWDTALPGMRSWNGGAWVTLPAATAGSVSFTPAGTGAVLRTAQDKLREIVSVKDFGAVGDGVTDDTAAFQAALNHAAKTDLGRVVGEAGKVYNCGSISAACGVTFDGNGCTVRATGASWLAVSSGAAFSASAVKNVKLRPTLPPSAGSCGIKFSSPAYNTRRTITIENVLVVGDDELSIGAYGFEKYVQLENAHYPTIRELRVDGTYNPLAVGPGPSGQFVTIGVSLEKQTVGTVIDHCRFGGVHTGVKASTVQQEGIQIIACEAVGVRDGYDLRSSSFGGPGVWLLNCHTNATRKGFALGFRTDVSLVNCTAYRSGVLFDEAWVGFDFESVFSGRVTTSTAVNSIITGTNDSIAFSFLNSSGVTGSSNEVRNTMRGVVLAGGCSDISFDSTGFYGASGYSTTVFQTAASDVDVYLGQHNIVSTWSNPYAIATYKDSIVIDYGRPNYNRTISASPSSTTTYTLTSGASPQHWRIGVGLGASAYDVNVDLSKTGARDGDYFDFYLNLPGAADRRVVFKDGVGGTEITTLATATSKRYGARFVFSRISNAWQAAWVNESVFI